MAPGGIFFMIGWGIDQSSVPSFFIQFYSTIGGGANITMPVGLMFSDALIQTSTYQLAMIQRTIGLFLFVKGNAYSNWTLANVLSNTTVTSPLYPTMPTGFVAKNLAEVDDMRIVNLPAPFDSNYGIVTSRNPTMAANGTSTHLANALIEVTKSFSAAEVYRLSFRMSDADNLWAYDITQGNPNGLMKLIERNSGVETTRVSQTVACPLGNNYLGVAFDTAVMHPNRPGLGAGNIYSSATFNQTATGMKTGADVTNFNSYPRLLDAVACAILDTAIAL
jgi:hypothetical protein